MKPAPFVHHAPRTVDEAVAVLAEVGHDGKVLAGGQSLIPVLNMRLASPGHLVDINGVAGLDAVDVTDAWVRVGALVRHAGLERDDAADAALPLLRQALRNVAHPAIRNRGTTVGSIAHADPAGEMPSVLVLTGGVVEAVGARGRREIAAADFFEGPLETTLAHDELVEAVRFGRFAPGTRTAFLESARRHGDYAIAGVAVAVEVDDDGGGALGPRLVRVGHPGADVLDLTPALAGSDAGVPLPRSVTDAVVELVRGHVDPEADIHASADYRRMLAAELTRRAVATALGADARRGSGMSEAGRADRGAAARHPGAGQRRRAVGAGTGPAAAVRLPAPRPAPHRHPRRLRARRVRRVHRARRRPADALVPDVRGLGAGPRDHHRRGHRQRPRGDEPGAAGVRRVPRAAVRLLHTGVHHDDHGLPRGQPGPDARGGPRGDLGQPVPVHRLPEHRQGRRPGRRDPPRGARAARCDPAHARASEGGVGS